MGSCLPTKRVRPPPSAWFALASCAPFASLLVWGVARDMRSSLPPCGDASSAHAVVGWIGVAAMGLAAAAAVACAVRELLDPSRRRAERRLTRAALLTGALFVLFVATWIRVALR